MANLASPDVAQCSRLRRCDTSGHFTCGPSTCNRYASPRLRLCRIPAQGATADDIVDFELNVCDTQAGVIGGARSLPASLRIDVRSHVR